MKKNKVGIFLVLALLALVSVASAEYATLTFQHSTDPNAYWDIDVAEGDGSTMLPAMQNYPGWCANLHIGISNGKYEFLVLSSLNTADPKWPSTIPKTNWGQINYVINHRETTEGTADWRTVQAVIWHYLGEAPPFSGGSIDGYDESQYKELIDAADKSGVGYTPICEEDYAVVLYKDGVQGIFAQVQMPNDDCDNPPPVPEFPSLALPAGMLVCLAGIVYITKRREN